jgi:putative transposase
LKYQPTFPRQLWLHRGCQKLLPPVLRLYNHDHHYAGIGLMTPDQVHDGRTEAVHAARQTTLDQAFRDNPERFVHKPPTPPNKPTVAWINPPTPKSRT